MKIVILGSNGMLGQMVKKYYSQKNGVDVQEYNVRFERENIFNYREFLGSLNNCLVINCIGKIPQKNVDSGSYYWTNTYLPHFLTVHLDNSNTLVQPSTDCVFSGSKDGLYNKLDFKDATDHYGLSKSLGEEIVKKSSNFLIIRVSIIGPDSNSNAGLMSWLLSCDSGSTVYGYSDHYWNGITTLEWCKRLDLILSKSMTNSVVQLGTNNVYSKYDVLSLINSTYDLGLKICKKLTGARLNKSLTSDLTCSPLDVQLKEIHKFYE